MKVKDKNNPMYGRTHRPEARRKISESRKKYVGKLHPSWKGGKRLNHNGYVEVRKPSHHRARGNGYVFEHILIAENKLGRKITKDEHVHHINEVKTDNRPGNLHVLSHSEHSKIHKIKKTGKYLVCERCGKKYYVKPSRVDSSRYCSLECVGKSSDIKSVNDKNISRGLLVETLKKNEGHKKDAARSLDIHWSTVYRLIKRYEVKENEYK